MRNTECARIPNSSFENIEAFLVKEVCALALMGCKKSTAVVLCLV